MRASSRAACLSARGVKWKKYSCTVTPRYEDYYKESAWTTYDPVGWVQEESANFCTSYSFDSATGKFTGSGSIWLGDGLSGTGYQITTDGVERIVSTSTEYTLSRKTALGPYTKTVYSVGLGDYLETIRSPEGAYPQAEDGYVFFARVTIGGVEYTMMKNGSDYYCYVEE